MTEQEAIKEMMGASVMVFSNEKKFSSSMRVAMKALEDVEQYRAIGTIEECRAAVEKIRKIYEVVNEWDKVGYSYSNNHMCEIKMIVKGGGI